jgi:hypothetical protein
MLKILVELFRGKRKERVEQIQDAVLGVLRLNEEGRWWETTVTVDNSRLGLKIGGDHEPDPALIEHGRDIVRRYQEFKSMLGEFLANEGRRLPGAADEIRKLVIEDVMLTWPNRPNDGMIYFKGPDKYRLWRCDYIGRKPQGLGFDD